MSGFQRTRIYNKEVMVDIETLSTEANAVILSIGAIKFDRNGKLPESPEVMDTFYTRIARESCEVLGMHVDPDTVRWWSTQPADVRDEALENTSERLTIKDALAQFATWIGKSELVWGHGDDFDCVILGNAFKRCGMKTPWKFWDTRDTRTLFDIAGVRNSDLPANSKHHPIHDCYRQIAGVLMSLRKLGV
jgi:DNA polymerase III epsilon subunit-like protein